MRVRDREATLPRSPLEVPDRLRSLRRLDPGRVVENDANSCGEAGPASVRILVARRDVFRRGGLVRGSDATFDEGYGATRVRGPENVGFRVRRLCHQSCG